MSRTKETQAEDFLVGILRDISSVLKSASIAAVFGFAMVWGPPSLMADESESTGMSGSDTSSDSKGSDASFVPPQLTGVSRDEIQRQLYETVVPLVAELEKKAGDVRPDENGPKRFLSAEAYFGLATALYAHTLMGPAFATRYYRDAPLGDPSMTPENRAAYLSLFSLGYALEGQAGPAGRSLQDAVNEFPLFANPEHVAFCGILQRRAVDFLGRSALHEAQPFSCSAAQLTRALLQLDDHFLQAFLLSEAAIFLTVQEDAALRCVKIGREALALSGSDISAVEIAFDYAVLRARSSAYDAERSSETLAADLDAHLRFHNESARYLLAPARTDLLCRIGALQYRLGLWGDLARTVYALDELGHVTGVHSAATTAALLRLLASHDGAGDARDQDLELIGGLSLYQIGPLSEWYRTERRMLFRELSIPLEVDPIPPQRNSKWFESRESSGLAQLFFWDTNDELMNGVLDPQGAATGLTTADPSVGTIITPRLESADRTVPPRVFYPVLVAVVVALSAMCVIILRLRDKAILLQERAAQFEEADERRRAMEGQVLRTSRLDNLAFQAIAAAHDLVNFMTAILHYATNNGRIAANPEPATLQRNSEALESAATKATGVAKKLMNIATRIRTPEPASDERSPGDLNEIILRDPQFLRVLVQEKGDLEFELAPRELIVACSPDYVELVIHNLVSNAAAACQPESGKVVVRTGSEVLAQRTDSPCLFGDRREGGSFHWLEVSDNGAGVSAEAMPKLFRTNFTDRERGNGIGLLTVLGVVNQHDGLIRLTTSPEGSTFRVLLPTSEAIAEKRSFSGLGDRSGYLGQIGLVAENAEPIDAALRRVLGPDKVSVVRFKTANAAVDWALSAGDCLGIISTVSEPEFAFLQLPRLEGEGREVPVMILADDGQQFEKMRAQSRLIRSVQSRDSDADSVAEAFVEHCLASPA